MLTLCHDHKLGENRFFETGPHDRILTDLLNISASIEAMSHSCSYSSIHLNERAFCQATGKASQTVFAENYKKSPGEMGFRVVPTCVASSLMLC